MQKIYKKDDDELDPEDIEDEHYTIETRSKCKIYILLQPKLMLRFFILYVSCYVFCSESSCLFI